LDETWPRFELKSFIRTVDYGSMSMREDQVRVQGTWNATRGGGQRPIIGERNQKQLVSGNYAWNLNDGSQEMEIYHMDQLEHAEDMLTVWFPKQKIIYEADLWNPPPAGAPAPSVSAQNMNFIYNMERLSIQPHTVVSTHTGVHPITDFLKFIGRSQIVARGGGANQALNQ